MDEVRRVKRGVEKKKAKCGICGKEFCSMKGLYGHMRTHPDRSWRGIQPPTMTTTATTTATSPPRWSLTAPRGRKSTASGSASTSTSSVRGAVRDLLFLAKKESLSKRKVHFEFDMTIITCQYSVPTSVDRPRTPSSCGQRMLDFDLNQLPPMEEEDGEGIES